VIDPYLAHWREFSRQFGGYITSNIPHTRRFVDVVNGADFGNPDHRLAWFDQELVPKWDGWQRRFGFEGINTQWLYDGAYHNT